MLMDFVQKNIRATSMSMAGDVALMYRVLKRFDVELTSELMKADMMRW